MEFLGSPPGCEDAVLYRQCRVHLLSQGRCRPKHSGLNMTDHKESLMRLFNRRAILTSVYCLSSLYSGHTFASESSSAYAFAMALEKEQAAHDSDLSSSNEALYSLLQAQISER